MLISKEVIKKPWFTAFASGAAVGIITHLFGLVTVIHNSDDIGNQPFGFGTGLRSGRWFLSMLGTLVKKLFGGYNIPYLSGLLFVLLVAVSAAVVVATLRLEKKRWAAFVGATFVVFPTISAIMLYKHTVLYYGIAILLSVLAVFFLDRFKFGLPLSVFCLALSMGIYQAFAPVTITLFVILLIKKAIKQEKSFKQLVILGFYYCLSLALGVGLYYLILQICLNVTNTKLGTYQEINNMGKISISELPQLIKKAYKGFLRLPVKDYCSLAQTKLIRLCYLVLGVFSVLFTVYLLISRVKNFLNSAFVVAMGIILPLAFNFIVIMCPSSDIYTLMVFSFVLAPCFPVILLDCHSPITRKWQVIFEKTSSKIVVLTLSILIFCYVYIANTNYMYLFYSNRQTENYMASIVTQVRMTEGFTSDKNWALIGTLDDPLLKGSWSKVPKLQGNATTQRLLTAGSKLSWMKTYIGYNVPIATDEEIAEIKEDPRFAEMPCWPDNGSIAIIDDIVVIKFSN